MENSITIRDDFDVELVEFAGSDELICKAARVSTLGAASIDSKESAGLIKFLMANRHGCYDDETDVLTSNGWKNWTEITGSELFITLDPYTNQIECQRAIRHIRKHYNGSMVKFKMAHVDCLVTPEHNMFAAPRTSDGWEYGLYPAHEFFERSHRIRLGGGLWDGDIHCPELSELIGFIAADGHVSNTSIDFHLYKSRKVKWLMSRHEISGFGDRYRLINANEELKTWAKQTYTEMGDRCFPRELLERGDAETIQALLDGYLVGDGHMSELGKLTCSTVSRQMVNDIQEAALKAGIAALETSPDIVRSGAYGINPLYKVSIYYRDRNNQPRIGWTHDARQEQVSLVDYSGEIHCVTVPNGVLYVRRNGKTMWCGNSPFEHSLLMFRISAPIVVWREFMRHRIGVSYNEQSGRYMELEGVFYIPPPDRNTDQIGKPGNYEFVPGTKEQYELIVECLSNSYLEAWESYQTMLKAGVAKEVARFCLPVAIYSTAYVTMNPRSIMHFLGLRTDEPTSMFPSKPQWEINQVANQMEVIFAEKFPITHKAFCDALRVAP